MAEDQEKSIPVSRYSTVQEKVAEGISSAGGKVQDAIVDALVTTEVNKRIEIAKAAHAALTKLRSDLNKINNPDSRMFDTNGNKVEMYSEARTREIKQKKEQLANLDNAFTTALTDNTKEAYDKLEKLSKNSGGGGDKAAEQN